MSAQLISRFKWLAVCLLCIGLFSGFAGAQSTTQGAIAGTVVDASGAVVPGAAVTLHNDGTSAEFKLVADESGTVQARLTDRAADIECGLVLRAIGYRGRPIAGVPFDSDAGVVPNDRGRIVDPARGVPVPGAFVTGWIKRGSSGGIGTNRKCAQDTVAQLLADHVAGLLPAPHATAEELAALLRARQPFEHDYAGWVAIDHRERETGRTHGRPRVKVTDPQLLRSLAFEALGQRRR